MSPKIASQFTVRLDALIERWAKAMPADLAEEFRRDFQPLGPEHDAALELIERAWTRREQTYAFDETGLARRRPFYQHLAALIGNPGSISAVGVLFVDVDQLKAINDTFGHAVGDQALQAIGTLLRESLRLDRRTGDLVTRTAEDYSVSHYGGDEFVAALELHAPEDIIGVARRISGRVNDRQSQRERGFEVEAPLTASVGAVACALAPRAPHAAATLARALVTAADEQMYRSKRDGHVHVAFAAVTTDGAIDLEGTRVVVL